MEALPTRVGNDGEIPQWIRTIVTTLARKVKLDSASTIGRGTHVGYDEIESSDGGALKSRLPSMRCKRSWIRLADEHKAAKAMAKFVALKRAEHRLRQRFETIDFEYDVLLPQRKELEQAITEGKVPVYELTDGTS